ncbi:fimbrial biogenesis chaperone [Parendozoicomonas haliclonae]|uniref:Pili assembly chaperone N-terminal domain-containing protein n=1 Tax=Parendozoicomonas haliclonae TaxID=1960125 RepID=A0A1X7AJ27_9GAMM|nr:fimbria/pilus periplasmic chaperone [Parendozoicomonas haliclonae]SMA45912.1 hypothetical protein EHSB41UT_02033 [Parendozoicomonas haliclonae]
MNRLRFLIAVAGLVLSQSILAQLAVDRIIVDFTKDSPSRNDVQLINTSESETLFINVEVLEVDKPGTPAETRIITDDPSKIGLVASPNRVILPPAGRRLVRLVNLLPAESEERIFRVNFSPVAGEFESEQNAVKLMVGYQALIIVRPEKTVFDLVGKREGNTLTLTNNSNTNVYLSNIRQCRDSKPVDCEYFVENRLYPGNVWELELSGKETVQFDAADGIESHEMSF